jgi:uncharacterized membrane protein YhaH (DUF805 family)
MDRKQWWAHVVLITVFGGVMLYAGTQEPNTSMGPPSVVVVAGLVVIAWTTTISVFRLRNIGKPGWWSAYFPVGLFALSATGLMEVSGVAMWSWLIALGSIPPANKVEAPASA